jgi:hypothetical protein
LLEVLSSAGSDRAVDHARSWLWSEDEDLAAISIRILGERSGPLDTALLVRRVRQDGPPQLRAAALRALDRPALDLETEAILLDALGTEQPVALRHAALEVSAGTWTMMGDPASRRAVVESRARYLPRLRAIAESDPDEATRLIARSQVRLVDEATGAVGESAIEDLEVLAIGCGMRISRRDHIVTGEPATSVRCHDGPWIERPPGRTQRLPSGMEVDEVDRFDDGESMWIAVDTGDDEPCWLTAENVRRRQPDDPSGGPSATTDFDLAIGATVSDSFLELEELGLVETFDRGTALVGVRLLVDSGDEALAAPTSLGDAWRVIRAPPPTAD